jgi:mRNA-degrading endonuclease toxin of MazEF toxin-antitoxin module
LKPGAARRVVWGTGIAKDIITWRRTDFDRRAAWVKTSLPATVLREGRLLANADESPKIAAEWFPLAEEAWQESRTGRLTTVAAIIPSVSPAPYPMEIVIEPAAVNGLAVRSSIRLDQVRTVDRQRLVRRPGRVDSTTMTRVDEALKISLGLISI